jgi:endonuclease YncB( thermonuclease family)
MNHSKKENYSAHMNLSSFSYRSNHIYNFFLFAILLLSGCNNKIDKNRNLVEGKVISIIDGDTYDVLSVGNERIRIRMEGIDAPEKGMPFYKVSKSYLSKLCFGKIIKVVITGKDNHKRFLGYTYLKDGTELSHEMISAGLAWHFKKYNSDTALSKLEIEARTLKKGLWINDNPMAPWTNRRLHKQGISTKDSFIIEQNNR